MPNLDRYATECILEMSTMLSCWDPEGEIAGPMRWSLLGDPVPLFGVNKTRTCDYKLSVQGAVEPNFSILGIIEIETHFHGAFCPLNEDNPSPPSFRPIDSEANINVSDAP